MTACCRATAGSQGLPRNKVPSNALLVACCIPLLLCVFIYFGPETLLTQITGFAILGIYVAFQSVVLAALRQRLRGWKPAGPFSLGAAGMLVNILALAYGLFAMVLLAVPGSSGDVLADWIVLIGLAVVAGTGALYLFIARPDAKSDAPSNDAIEVAEKLRAAQRSAAPVD